MRIKRVYRHYLEWEEIGTQMWSNVDNKKSYLKKAIDFTGDHKKYGRFMLLVVKKWPISCENWLTDSSCNRRAWIGHAAAAMAINCPESITREAWSYLTDEQRALANREADRAIAVWEKCYSKNKLLQEDVDKQMLL